MKEFFLLFQVEKKLFGMPVNLVEQVVAAVEFTPFIDGHPCYIPGVINVAGEPATVVDIRLRCGFPPKKLNSSHKFILTRENNNLWVLWVDKAEEVIELDSKELMSYEEDAQDNDSSPLATVAVKFGDERVIIIKKISWFIG